MLSRGEGTLISWVAPSGNLFTRYAFASIRWEEKMQSEFCDRYRERKAPNRHMLALRGTKVDLAMWELISFSATPPSRMKALSEKGFVILEEAARRVA